MPEPSDHASAADTVPTRLDQSQNSHLDSLYRAAIGPIHAAYYLPILSRFETYGRASPSWNWAAFGITLNWMLFRGLWLPAVLYLAALSAAALALAAGIALADPRPAESVQWSLWAGLLTLALLTPGFFGNAWLFRVYRQRLDTALAATTSLKDACMLLARRSSSRPRLLAITLANIVLAVLLAASLWPSALHQRMWPRVSGDVGGVAASDASPLPPPAAAASGPLPIPSVTASDPLPSPIARASGPSPSPAAAESANEAPRSPANGLVASGKGKTNAPVGQAPTGPATAGNLAGHDLQSLGPAARATLQRQATIAGRARAAHVRAPAATTASPAASAQAPAPAPAPATASASASASAPASATTPAPDVDKQPVATGPYLINVGLFAQQDNALRAHARLKQAGLPALSESLQTPGGQRTRVRVGPFATRAQADAAAQQIRALQLDAVVIRP